MASIMSPAALAAYPSAAATVDAAVADVLLREALMVSLCQLDQSQSRGPSSRVWICKQYADFLLLWHHMLAHHGEELDSNHKWNDYQWKCLEFCDVSFEERNSKISCTNYVWRVAKTSRSSIISSKEGHITN